MIILCSVCGLDYVLVMNVSMFRVWVGLCTGYECEYVPSMGGIMYWL